MNDLYGWFDRADQTEPTYESPRNAPCPYCGEPCTDRDVRTHSLMAVERTETTRSYFYRTHRTCDEAASDGQRQAVFNAVLNRIAHDSSL